MDQLERIRRMEQLLDECTAALDDPAQYPELADKIDTLAAYYLSPMWRCDLDDDTAGKLPSDLKRGVLSEDAVYNLLCDWDQYKKHM